MLRRWPVPSRGVWPPEVRQGSGKAAGASRGRAQSGEGISTEQHRSCSVRASAFRFASNLLLFLKLGVARGDCSSSSNPRLSRLPQLLRAGQAV